ncbi:MAG TPA: aspartate/glutamate racemase family protein [Verrucomicrobiae bacterium]|nr:aspartate/glutamate racemase family protein [Verrucomicrobiae bacterium]
MPSQCFGLVGGLGVGAAIHYYRELAKVHDALHVPMDLVMVHADMPRMVRWAEAGDATSMARYVAGLIARLQAAGAAFAALPAVTPHLCISELQPISPLPLVNLLEAVDDSVRSSGFRRVALFGTRFTIESAMFGALSGVEVVPPRPDEIDYIHKTYYQLASTGLGGTPEREGLTSLAQTLIRRDAVDAIVLAGTDLALIFDESNISFPHVDCARIHLDRILATMLGSDPGRAA